MTPLIVRKATEHDASALLAIYRPFVDGTAVSFETVVPTVEEFAVRIEAAVDRYQWLVAERNGECLGYAYGSSHRERPAYRWSVEVSAYVRPNSQRQHIGSKLYSQLLHELTLKGFCNAYAGISLPNDSSIALHRSFAFEQIGIFKAVGRKFNVWHDVAWFQRVLRESPLSEERA